nr:transcription antitermination factor NusB [Candidatus Cloacimonadota bacterium]
LEGVAADKEILPNNPIYEFASDLVLNVLKHIDPIDERIKVHSTNWSFDRIAKLDVSVMRVAVYELIYTETAPAIIMNEAIEIAKKYCSESSGKFINGVLNAISKDQNK